MGLVIEGGGLDAGSFSIDQVDADQVTFASGILPGSEVVFASDARLDAPVRAELIQSLDGHELVHGGRSVHTHQVVFLLILVFEFTIGSFGRLNLNGFEGSSQVFFGKAILGIPARWDPQVIVLGELARLLVGVVVFWGTNNRIHMLSKYLRCTLQHQHSTQMDRTQVKAHVND